MQQKKIIIVVLLIVSIGLAMVYSASNVWAQYNFDDPFYHIKRQSIFAVLGILCMFVTSKIDYHIYQKYCKKILLFGLLLLILVLIPGLGSVRGGSRSWFSLGIISFQPAEVFKIAMIIYTANYISKHYHQLKKLKNVLPLLLVLGLGFGIIMLQPDFGSATVMASAIIIMLLVSPMAFKYFFYLGISGIAGIVAMIMAAPYRLQRITAYLDPFADPLGSGFQMIQSLYAIGPAGILGVGYNNSIQKHFYLPEPQTDFIFAIYCEEFGFVGGVFLIFLYAYLFIYILKIALRCQDLFGCFLMIGIISLIGIQTLINLGVVVGLFPVTGDTYSS